MLKKLIQPFVLVWLSILFVLPLPFLYSLKTGLAAMGNTHNLGVLLGVLAYIWMLTAIYIATKPKWLDRLIGLPSSYMIHGMLSLLAIIFAFIHKELDPSHTFIKWTGDVAFVIFLGLAAYSMIFIAGWLTSRIPILLKLKQLLEEFFKHELSVWLHRLNVIATFLIFVHIHLIHFIVSIKPFMILIWCYSLFVFLSYIWFHFGINARGVTSELIENTEVLNNVRMLRIKLTRPSSFVFKPGDFAFISFPDIKGMAEPHPFSILNAPNNDGDLIFTIRGDGDFTKKLINVPVNSRVLVKGSYGQYQSLIDNYHAKDLFIIAGGIGVVPLMSIIEGNQDLKTQFFYTVKDDSQMLFPDKIKEWQSRPNFRAYYQVGRYTDDFVLSQLPNNSSNCVYLIGGPITMGRHWKETLIKSGIPPERIYFEEFSW